MKKPKLQVVPRQENEEEAAFREAGMRAATPESKAALKTIYAEVWALYPDDVQRGERRDYLHEALRSDPSY